MRGPVVDVGGPRHGQVGRGEQLEGGPLERSLGQDQAEHRLIVEVGDRRSATGGRGSGAGATISTAVTAASQPLLASPGAGTGQGLVDGVGGEHAEDDRDPGVELDPLDARRRTRRPRSRSGRSRRG